MVPSLRRIILLCALLAACKGHALADVARAATPAEERAAFAALVRSARVGFSAYDATGKQLDLGAPRWWEQARTLRITADGESLEHTLLGPENVEILMQE